MTGFADEFYEDHVESMLDDDLPKPLHSLSPQELADQGIPVEVALRARTAEAWRIVGVHDDGYDRGKAHALGEVLAIIEAKR